MHYICKILYHAFRLRPFGRSLLLYGRLAAATATAAGACGGISRCIIVAAAGGVITVILLDKKIDDNKNQYPCAGIAAKKTVAAHRVLPPFSDFTIYYAIIQRCVKN